MTHPVPRTLAAMAVACTAMFAATAHAADLVTVNLLNQDQFRLLSEDLGSAAAYKPLIPSEATGVTGFDVGGAVMVNQIKNRSVFQLAANNEDPGATLTQYALRANKGLPFDLDIGASVSQVSGTNIQVAGADLRWAAILGGTFIPAVSLRLAISNISGVDQVDLKTTSFDVSLSKGFAFITPYAGLGVVQVKSTPNVAGLAAENFNLTRIFAGTNVALGLMNFIIEADKTGEAANLGMKLGIRF
jgi:hypothetical protein